MQNKKLIILIFLGAAAIFSLIHGLITPAKRIQGSLSHPPRQKIIIASRIARRSNYDTWSRNPFSQQKITAKTVRGLLLNGIMWDKEKPMAIINDDVAEIGSKINGNTVVAIKQDRVILYDGASNFELKLE